MKRGSGKLQFLDRFIGIPLVFILGLFRIKKKRNFGALQKVAFFEGNAIGDTVLLLGAIHNLKHTYPDSKLIFFSGSTNYEIAKLSDQIDTLIKLPLNNPFECVRLIRNQGMFDVFIDFMSWPRISSILTAFAKSKMKVGFKTQNQYRHYAYDVAVVHSDKVHEIENFNTLLNVIDIVPKFSPWIRGTLGTNHEKSIVLHMFPSGSKSYLKKWPAKNWLDIASYFLEKGYHVSITGGPSDKIEGAEFASKFSVYPHFHNYAGTLSLKNTIEVLNGASLVISVNTGIMHIASALHVNLIALHGPTSVLRWGPLNENSISIQSSHPRAPCLNLGFEYKCNNTFCNCMALITTEEVINKANLLLSQ